MVLVMVWARDVRMSDKSDKGIRGLGVRITIVVHAVSCFLANQADYAKVIFPSKYS